MHFYKPLDGVTHGVVGRNKAKQSTDIFCLQIIKKPRKSLIFKALARIERFELSRRFPDLLP